jgi:hypothetical protein
MSGTVVNGPLGTTANAYSILSFQNGAYTTQLYFDKNTLGLKEWGNNTAPLTTNAGNGWYKVVTTNGNNIFTDGGLIFAGKTSDASSEVKQDDANLHWDNTNKRLGVGTNSPAAKLDVNGDFKLGSNGTVLSSMFKLMNVPITSTTYFDYNNTNELTVDLSSYLGGRTLSTGATIILNPRSDLPNHLAVGWVRRSSDTDIRIGFINTDSSARLGTVNFDITIIQ